ncbi:MAG TPA: glycosyltransferase, partial [Thermoanaerobaculia bacterium]|nr:glycosyltransferase [Thermoanaerobaculia bacterium]
MTAPRLVTVAILSWNGRQHLETCLDALAEQEDPGVEWEVLVLDNGSTDGTGDWLQTRYPRGRMAESAGIPASAMAPAEPSPAPQQDGRQNGLPSALPQPGGRQAEEQSRLPFADSPGWVAPSPGAPAFAWSPLPAGSRGPADLQVARGSPGSRESPGAAELPVSPELPGSGPAVRWLASPVNLGFCAGNNRLVGAATGEAVAFLNNDTRPGRGWLAALVRALAAAPPDVAAVSGKIVDWEGERLDFGRGVMTFDGHAFQLDFRRPLDEARVPARGEELLFACGGNMLIRRASFLAAGGFDESYFAYLEDVDLGWRLWSGGERVIFEPEAVVRHRSNATSDLLGLFNRGFLFERNAFLTAYKNYQPGLWEKVMPVLLLTFLSRTQTMLADNNPGGSSLRIDPYAGWIANTAAPANGAPATGAPATSAPATRAPATSAPAGPSGEQAGGA